MMEPFAFRVIRIRVFLVLFSALILFQGAVATLAAEQSDLVRELQAGAIAEGRATWGHWGADPAKYCDWQQHSNRLVPIYTFGTNLDKYQGANSIYRDPQGLARLYGRVPDSTVNPHAEYLDQTDVFHLQQDAAAGGKKFIFLVILDGMDWQTAQAAAIYQANQVAFESGRGSGLKFLDYRGVTTDFGYVVTSPHNDGTKVDIAGQVVLNPGGETPGGYDPILGGSGPWDLPKDPGYLLGLGAKVRHAVTDSAASATSMCTGIKTYNDAVNVNPHGKQVPTLAHGLQAQGWGIGLVSSVPVSHATPAAGYAHNVSRDDYHNLFRDLVGQRSAAHRQEPLPGADVVLGAGWEPLTENLPAGQLFSPSNRYISTDAVHLADVAQGGKYRVVVRTGNASGRSLLATAAHQAATNGERLLGIFGTQFGHLPFRTADGRFDPVADVREAETYTDADLRANPSLTELTTAALTVLQQKQKFWLLVEAGDVDWANHANNLDNSIGAVLSGDEAVNAIFQWIEAHDAWEQSVVIVTADHGHDLCLDHPEALTSQK